MLFQDSHIIKYIQGVIVFFAMTRIQVYFTGYMPGNRIGGIAIKATSDSSLQNGGSFKV